MPQISVIVPVYQVEKYIHRCVDSILAQTFTDFELILVDDGSPDNCGAICDEYAREDSRVVVIHQENSGLSAARNAGIDWAFANSDSQWLTFIDSDDWVHPEYLERLLDAAVKNGVSIGVCGYAETQGDEPEIAEQEWVSQIWSPEDFYVAHNVNAIIACAKLYRKECFENIRYPAGRIHEDEFTTFLLLFPNEQIAVISAPAYFYFQNPKGITKSQWTPMRLDAAQGLDQQRLYFRKYGFLQAHQAAAKSCIFRLCSDIDLLEKHPEHKTYLRKTRRQLRKTLRQEWKLFPFEHSNLWCYEGAYPRTMYIYWTCVGVCNKIKRGFTGCQK